MDKKMIFLSSALQEEVKFRNSKAPPGRKSKSKQDLAKVISF